MFTFFLVVLVFVSLGLFIWFFSRGDEWMMTEEQLAEHRRNSDNG